MKTENYHFQWFKKEDARRTLRASISKDGKLRLGQGLRKQLPPHIRVGFDVKSRVLAIAGGTDADILWPKIGVFNMRALAAQITSLGLTLPISFQMADQPSEHCLRKDNPSQAQAALRRFAESGLRYGTTHDIIPARGGFAHLSVR